MKLTAALTAGTGPVPMMDGSTPACAHATTWANDLMPRCFASLSLIRTKAAAPSLMPEEFPAVTEPDPSCKTIYFTCRQNQNIYYICTSFILNPYMYNVLHFSMALNQICVIKC